MTEDGMGLPRRDQHLGAAADLLAQAHLDIRTEADKHLVRVVHMAVGPA